MWKVARNFKKDSDESNLSGGRFSIVAANNHYAGFGPGTVNIFRQLLGLEEMKWGDEQEVKQAGKEDDDDYNHKTAATQSADINH